MIPDPIASIPWATIEDVPAAGVTDGRSRAIRSRADPMNTPADGLEPKLAIEPLAALPALDEIGDRIDDVDDLDLDSI